jgi:excisionase family DNA binding protein
MKGTHLVSVREAAIRLNLNPRTIRRMILRGDLDGVRLGHRYRVRLPEVAL